MSEAGHGHGHGSGHAHDHPAHDREHDHGHGHEHGSAENPFAGQGSVLLDIGGDIGAIVVTMPAGMLDDEVEIRPAGQQDGSHLPHVAVVNRPLGATVVPSLVFGEVAAGRYELCPKGTYDVRLTLDVTGGEVTTATWPGSDEDALEH